MPLQTSDSNATLEPVSNARPLRGMVSPFIAGPIVPLYHTLLRRTFPIVAAVATTPIDKPECRFPSAKWYWYGLIVSDPPPDRLNHLHARERVYLVTGISKESNSNLWRLVIGWKTYTVNPKRVELRGSLVQTSICTGQSYEMGRTDGLYDMYIAPAPPGIHFNDVMRNTQRMNSSSSSMPSEQKEKVNSDAQCRVKSESKQRVIIATCAATDIKSDATSSAAAKLNRWYEPGSTAATTTTDSNSTRAAAATT